MHARFVYVSKVLAKVKVDNRQANRQTGQKQYASDYSIRGIKMTSTKMDTPKSDWMNNIDDIEPSSVILKKETSNYF